jgi:hypothetical protein
MFHLSFPEYIHQSLFIGFVDTHQNLIYGHKERLGRKPFEQHTVSASRLGHALLLNIVDQDNAPGLRPLSFDLLQRHPRLFEGQAGIQQYECRTLPGDHLQRCRALAHLAYNFDPGYRPQQGAQTFPYTTRPGYD